MDMKFSGRMPSRNYRTFLFFILLAYLLLLLIFSRNQFLAKCWHRNEPALLEFTIEVNNKDGHGRTDKLKFSVDNRGKQFQTINKESTKEDTVIEKKLNNGVVHFRKDTIELTDQNHILFERQQKEESNPADMRKNKNNDFINLNTQHDQNQQTLQQNTNKQKKYIFSLRYYEQLTMATNNLISLASLGTHTNRHVVMPFVNNSRFSGLQSGASISRFIENEGNIKPDALKFSNLSTYFDVPHLNNKLNDHGYTSLASFEEFKQTCTKLDIVIHFLYRDSEKDLEKWYKLPKEKIDEIQNRVKKNGGVAECKFVRRSRMNVLLGRINVTRYVCVDPEIIRTPEDLENKVLKHAQCVGIVLWKGVGHNRAHFDTAPSISEVIRPSNLKHNSKLIDIAYSYIRNIVKRPFISVHVRSERHFRKGINAVQNCLRKISKTVLKRLDTFNLKKIFVSSDLEWHGSDTLLKYIDTQKREELYKDLLGNLSNPYTFNPQRYNLFDRGEIAIVEMHILSMGESLFTLGRGNFQDWIVDLFLFHNAEDKSLIYKVCEFEANSGSQLRTRSAS